MKDGIKEKFVIIIIFTQFFFNDACSTFSCDWSNNIDCQQLNWEVFLSSRKLSKGFLTGQILPSKQLTLTDAAFLNITWFTVAIT